MIRFSWRIQPFLVAQLHRRTASCESQVVSCVWISTNLSSAHHKMCKVWVVSVKVKIVWDRWTSCSTIALNLQAGSRYWVLAATYCYRVMENSLIMRSWMFASRLHAIWYVHLHTFKATCSVCMDKAWFGPAWRGITAFNQPLLSEPSQSIHQSPLCKILGTSHA